ncbi:MAG: DUF2283 domain-containing protein [Dehalococcoidia bacterium]
MIVRYDSEVDALYISFRVIEPGGAKRTLMLDDRRMVDYDAADHPIGVEFLCFSEGIDLEDVPRAEEIATALRAFATAPA